jgi:prepilin-type N-terminal cleavage/methylation domain-containing protein
MKKPSQLHIKSAFSLVELLVVIAVIAIIAAIAIPNIAGITGSATTAKNQRNAQNVVSTFSAARAAGLTNSYTKDTAIAAVAGSTTISSNGMTAGMEVGGLNMTPDDIDGVEPYIATSGNGTSLQLIYDSDGGN